MKDNNFDIRDYFLIAIMAFLFGISSFSWDWWMLIKIPLLASGLVFVHAIGLYFIRKD